MEAEYFEYSIWFHSLSQRPLLPLRLLLVATLKELMIITIVSQLRTVIWHAIQCACTSCTNGMYVALPSPNLDLSMLLFVHMHCNWNPMHDTVLILNHITDSVLQCLKWILVPGYQYRCALPTQNKLLCEVFMWQNVVYCGECIHDKT